MQENKLEVVKWFKAGEKFACNTLWVGATIRKAFASAGDAFIDALIEKKYPESDWIYLKEKSRREFIDLDFSLIPDCRITILECIDGRKEAAGEKPKIVYSLGDDKIKIFQRCHFG